MDVVVENPEEAILKDCVVDPGSAKPRDPRGKNLGDEPNSTGTFGSVRENSARVSENGDEQVKPEILSEKGVGVENLNDSENLEDSEMNGVSSLLKMKQHYGEKENANPSVESGKNTSVQHEEESGKEEEEDEEEEEEEEEHGFQVGDFVWGKIKSHPWWPGQIYDSSNASELALKIKRKRRLLVAYFGDGTFAWCRPSQLKPFEENFKEFSRVSGLRGFVKAVEEAVEEMGRHVECLMTEQLGDGGAVRPAAVNAGIKEGVHVPNVRREIISSFSFEPREILGDIEALSKNLVFDDLLELEVLKRKISAFYQSKGVCNLIEYHEAQPIPGLEDKNEERAIKVCGRKSSSEVDGRSPDKSHQRSLEHCSGFPEHRLHHRRKQKSIAEILERAQVKAEAEAASASASAGGKKRKRDDRVKDMENTSTTPRSGNKLLNIENAAPKQEDKYSKEKSFSRKRKKRGADAKDDASNRREETTDVEESDQKKTSDLEGNEDSTPLASLRKKVKVDVPSVQIGSGNGKTVQTPNDSNDSLSRERKKSKYLSPPYTSGVILKNRKSEIEAESLKVSSQTRVGERMSNAAGNIVGMNCGRPLDTPGEASDLDSGHQESSDDLRRAMDFLRSGAPAKEVRDQIRATALTPQHPKSNSSDHLMRKFISIYRSFTYHYGANNKMHCEQTSEKENGQNRKEENETSNLSKKKGKKSENTPKEKHPVEEQDECTELLVTFGPCSNLPKKDDLIRIYGKYGSLDEERTDIFYNNNSARVVFVNPRDAEAAFESSQEKCPFTASSAIEFRLKLPSAAPGKSKERTEKKPGNPRIGMEYVKEKLNEMRSMVDKTGGGMTKELKVKLEEEIRNLLEKVSMMVVSTS